jgi:hypothetical protein
VIHDILLGAMFAVAVDAPALSPLCGRGVSQSFRPRDVLQLSVRATPDSLPDPRREVADPAYTGYGARVSWDTAAVYGQLFALGHVDGTLGGVRWRDHTHVVLIWWRDGVQCQRITPRPAVRRDVEDLFLLARPAGSQWAGSELIHIATLRPPRDWVQGIPTIDVTGGSWMYSPQQRRPVNLPPGVQGGLSLPEYRDFFAHLPQSPGTYEDQRAARNRLLIWGDAVPRRWTLFPAAGELCAAAMGVRADDVTRRRCPQ